MAMMDKHIHSQQRASLNGKALRQGWGAFSPPDVVRLPLTSFPASVADGQGWWESSNTWRVPTSTLRGKGVDVTGWEKINI